MKIPPRFAGASSSVGDAATAALARTMPTLAANHVDQFVIFSLSLRRRLRADKTTRQMTRPCRFRALERDLAGAEASGEMRPLARRCERRTCRGAGLDGKPAARPERAARVEPGQVGRLAVNRVEPRLARPIEPWNRT